jgi:hypothetical protein
MKHLIEFVLLALALIPAPMAFAAPTEAFECSGVATLTQDEVEQASAFQLRLFRKSSDKFYTAEIPNAPGSSKLVGIVKPNGNVAIVNADAPSKVAFLGTLKFLRARPPHAAGLSLSGKAYGVAAMEALLLCEQK